MSPKPNQTIHNTSSKFFQITGIILEIRNGSNFYLALVTRVCSVDLIRERRSILWDQTEKRNQLAEMNSLPSDNRQMVNAFLVKSHKSFWLLGSVPSIIEPKSIFYIFKISSDILKSQLLYQIPPSIFTKNIIVSGKVKQIRGGDSVILGESWHHLGFWQ